MGKADKLFDGSNAHLLDEQPEIECNDFEEDSDYPKDCFGCYSPGTKDCDWCEFADECAQY